MNVNERGIKLFWENYHRAFQWQNSSQLSHWQARARALEVENAYLRNFIQQELHSRPLKRSRYQASNVGGSNSEKSRTSSRRKSPFYLPEESELQHFDHEISEDLLAFYEKTIRHKIERKKRQSEDRKRDSDDSQSENEQVSSMGPINSAQKSSDMDFLYGCEAPKILSMELSMQINFDMNRNNSQAQLWPNIPLRLS